MYAIKFEVTFYILNKLVSSHISLLALNKEYLCTQYCAINLISKSINLNVVCEDCYANNLYFNLTQIHRD